MDRITFALKLLEESKGGTINMPPVRNVYLKEYWIKENSKEVWVKFDRSAGIIDYPITKFFPDFEELFTKIHGGSDVSNAPSDK